MSVMELEPHANSEGACLSSRCPWRRWLARGLDFALYALLWQTVLGVGLRLNIAQRSGGEKLLDNLVTLLLMFCLEPLLLHRFSTTLGKWLFSLRLTRSDGSPLSLSQSFRRTGLVICLGEGFLMPVLALAANGLSYYRCKHDIPQPWALEDEMWWDGSGGTADWWDSRGSMLRAGGYVGARVLCFLLSLAILSVASIPRHRGAPTPAQFADNYNQLLRFDSAPHAPSMLLGADGGWYQADPNVLVVDVFGQGQPELHLDVRDGVVTGLSLTLEKRGADTIYYVPTHQMRTALRALLGRGLPLTGGSPFGRLLEELSQTVPGTRTWQADGWTVTCALEMEGYQSFGDSYGMGDMLIPLEGDRQLLVLDFSIRPS